ncbi:hypothetical protein PI124_g18824 [Phytophthora idaei]|nr:hypothetical protein PI125_g19721 [Phytophthora idaei]KAG3135660.1 hypothetical protein PI126_g18158 [Phytophthora idaei]KAG3236163.1 hypothetical protein PI124_g18824 [Phytophthora idaei]
MDAFVSGTTNTWCATLVRGQRPSTLNKAVNAALDQDGVYGEGYGVGLGMAMKVQDERTASTTAVLVLAPDVTRMLLSAGPGLGSVASGHDNFGLPPLDTTQKGGSWCHVETVRFKAVARGTP